MRMREADAYVREQGKRDSSETKHSMKDMRQSKQRSAQPNGHICRLRRVDGKAANRVLPETKTATLSRRAALLCIMI